MKKVIVLIIGAVFITHSLLSMDFDKLKSVIDNYSQDKQSYISALEDYGFPENQVKSWRFTKQQIEVYFPVLIAQIQKGDKVFSTNIGTLKAINDVSHELSSSEYDKLMLFIRDIETVASQMRDERVKILDKNVISNNNGIRIIGYNLTYDGNGNTGGTVPIDETLYSGGSLVQLDDGSGMVKDGHNFMGWNFYKDATSWLSSSKININHDTTVYAVWAEIRPQNEQLVEIKPAPRSETQQTVGYSVYISRTGTRYHRANCRTLRNGGTPIDINSAKSRGLTACKVCNP